MGLRLTPKELAKLTGAKQPRRRTVRAAGTPDGREPVESTPIAQDSSCCVWVAALPPSVNHMYVNNGRGGKVLTDGARLFRDLVAAACRLNGYTSAPDGNLALTMRLTYPDKRKSDLDNRLKAAQDALALALGFDDRRIVRLVAERAGYDPGRPACEMTLEVLQ